LRLRNYTHHRCSLFNFILFATWDIILIYICLNSFWRVINVVNAFIHFLLLLSSRNRATLLFYQWGPYLGCRLLKFNLNVLNGVDFRVFVLIKALTVKILVAWLPIHCQIICNFISFFTVASLTTTTSTTQWHRRSLNFYLLIVKRFF
jgi:hypothetical protein